jgi:hypothetical protein
MLRKEGLLAISLSCLFCWCVVKIHSPCRGDWMFSRQSVLQRTALRQGYNRFILDSRGSRHGAKISSRIGKFSCGRVCDSLFPTIDQTDKDMSGKTGVRSSRRSLLQRLTGIAAGVNLSKGASAIGVTPQAGKADDPQVAAMC